MIVKIMSSYIREINNKRYACIDDYYWIHKYWYVELKEWEYWINFDIRWRKVYNDLEFNKIIWKKEI